MYVSVLHDIKDPASFQTRGQRLTDDLPPGTAPLQFFPDTDGARAVCLWQGGSVDAVRDHIDGRLGDASQQEYFAVAADRAVGLPVAQTA